MGSKHGTLTTPSSIIDWFRQLLRVGHRRGLIFSVEFASPSFMLLIFNFQSILFSNPYLAPIVGSDATQIFNALSFFLLLELFRIFLEKLEPCS